MKINHVFLGLFLTLLSGCCKEETQNGLEGKWFLINASGGIAGISQDYPKGQIIWNFDDDDQLHITNNYTGNWNVSFPSQDLSYQIKETIEGDELILDNEYFGNILLQMEDTLLISQAQFADGFGFLFVK